MKHNVNVMIIKGVGRGAEDRIKKRKMTIDEKDDPCKFSQTPPKKPKNLGGKVNPEEFLKLRQFWANFFWLQKLKSRTANNIMFLF